MMMCKRVQRHLPTLVFRAIDRGVGMTGAAAATRNWFQMETATHKHIVRKGNLNSQQAERQTKQKIPYICIYIFTYVYVWTVGQTQKIVWPYIVEAAIEIEVKCEHKTKALMSTMKKKRKINIKKTIILYSAEAYNANDAR